MDPNQHQFKLHSKTGQPTLQDYLMVDLFSGYPIDQELTNDNELDNQEE